MHPVGLEPTTSISTLLWHGEAVPFELELIDKYQMITIGLSNNRIIFQFHPPFPTNVENKNS